MARLRSSQSPTAKNELTKKHAFCALARTSDVKETMDDRVSCFVLNLP